MPASDFTDINLTGLTQFRVRFTKISNNNNSADFDAFYSGDTANAPDRPVLTVYYSLP